MAEEADVRRHRRYPSPRTSRAWQWTRLAWLVMLFAVVFLVMRRLQDPDVVRSIGLLLADNAPAKPEAAAKTAPPGAKPPKATPPQAKPPDPPPAVTGPTDQDAEEAEAIREEFQAVDDRTLTIQPEEMFAYSRLVQWVLNQPAPAMLKRARRDLVFNDFIQSPQKYRGALVELELNARIVRKYDEPEMFDFPLHEVWGFTRDSGAWLYNAIVVDLPEGMPVGVRVSEQVRVVGYFFKLQGYYPGKAKPGARPEPAPLLIGRLVWVRPDRPQGQRAEWPWGWVLLGGLLLVIGVRLSFLLFRRRRGTGLAGSARPVGRSRPGSLSVDDWFERAEAGEVPDPDLLE